MIAALNGHALGGGAEVAVAADIRIAADDIKIGFNQSALAIMPAWGGAERLAALVGKSRALLLAGAGTILEVRRGRATRAGGPGTATGRFSRAGWRAAGARSLATAQAGRDQASRRRGVGSKEAVDAFARLWVADEHWVAAEKVMKRAK